jgi:hypothetical protein
MEPEGWLPCLQVLVRQNTVGSNTTLEDNVVGEAYCVLHYNFYVAW